MKRKQMTERMYDDGGQLLLEEPYPFSRLFAAGQEQVLRGVRMTVLECKKAGNMITTRVKLHGLWPTELHGPWPTANAQALAEERSDDRQQRVVGGKVDQ